MVGIGLANHVSTWLGLLAEGVRVEMEVLVLKTWGIDLRIDDLGPLGRPQRIRKTSIPTSTSC